MAQNIKWIDLQQKGYKEVWELQEKLLEEVKSRKQNKEDIQHYLLFVEHPPVYTLGKSGDAANMLINTIELSRKQAEFIKVDRGGDITFHGPGQLVVYPIFDLESFGLGVKDYVEQLEEIVLRVLLSYGIQAERMDGATGVWIESTQSNPRKICAIGVKCSRYVSMHGFALNVNTDLSYFKSINPCGFVDKEVTSIQKELGSEVDMQGVKDEVLKQFNAFFGEASL